MAKPNQTFTGRASKTVQSRPLTLSFLDPVYITSNAFNGLQIGGGKMTILTNVLRRAVTSRCTRRRLIVIAPKRAHGILSAIPFERKGLPGTKGRVRLVAHSSSGRAQVWSKTKVCVRYRFQYSLRRAVPESYGRTWHIAEISQPMCPFMIAKGQLAIGTNASR